MLLRWADPSTIPQGLSSELHVPPLIGPQSKILKHGGLFIMTDQLLPEGNPDSQVLIGVHTVLVPLQVPALQLAHSVFVQSQPNPSYCGW